ncbi:MAG: cysteine desulfurase [Actinomycetia bacterium]|nr:cysteine desulfurase [Actinomycetes bacterium]
MADKIFFDHASATPVNKEVLDEMQPFFSTHYGNPSSLHDFGQQAKDALEEARSRVARLIGASPEEIYFTSSGTESNNFALFGLARALQSKGQHIISSSIEHISILNPLKELKKMGWQYTLLPVDEYGLVDVKQLEKEIREDTALITVMHANNEVGTIQNIKDLAQIASSHDIVFHSDGVATAGIIEVDVNQLGVDAYSVSSQQMYGPKGAAALYIRKGTRVKPFIIGGTQESGRRAGTENVPAIVGFGKAAELAKAEMDKNKKHLTSLRDQLIEGITKSIKNVKLNGHPEQRLPGNVHFSFEYIEGESILLLLNMEGIAAASGSSCVSQALKNSQVLLSMGISPTMAQGSVLFSLGKFNTEKEVLKTVEVLPPIIKKLRQMSPLYKEE